MIIARCPACLTVFRARPEQLSAHAGRVRCGHCFTPFNALENLIETQDAAPTDAPDKTTLAAHAARTADAAHKVDAETARSAHPFDHDAFFLLQEPADKSPSSHRPDAWILEEKPPDTNTNQPHPDERPTPLADAEITTPPVPESHQADTFERIDERLDFVMPNEFLTSRPRNPPLAARSAAHPEHSEIDTPAPDTPTPDAPAPEPPATNTTTESTVDEALPSPSLDVSPGHSIVGHRALCHEDTPLATASMVAAAPATEGPSPNPRRYGSTPLSPARRWLMGLAIGVLLGTLGAQVAYHSRAEITRAWPELRPLYQLFCDHFGCELALPRVAAAIRISRSSLESDPADATRFILNANIVNQARHPLALPHLELTLTDARDRPVVRRVLDPATWAPDADASVGLPAGGEIEVTLTFGAPDLSEATGYRVYAFYP